MFFICAYTKGKTKVKSLSVSLFTDFVGCYLAEFKKPFFLSLHIHKQLA